MTLTLLPAVDVAGGRAVRLVQGAAGTETSYGDPLTAALAWQSAGAAWIHLVDLDAAFGRGSNAALLAEVVGRLDVAVELSGGIRDDESLAAALATGCARVNVGTAALERPEWVRAIIAEHGERIAVGLDVRGTRLAARGWTREGGDLEQTLARLDGDGCRRFVVTDVTKDGTLTGPNLDLLRSVCARTGRPVIASGGVSQPRRPAGDRRAGPAGSGGRHCRQGALRGSIHPGAGTGGGEVVTRKISTRTTWEPVVGYSRAVAAGDFVFVSGCTSVSDGVFVHEGDARAQAAQAIANVAEALERLGASLADVVRTRMYVTDISRWEEYGLAHGAAFGDTMPATSMVGIAALVDPRMLVEVEAVAYKPGVGG